MSFREPWEARISERRKCSIAYTVLRAGGYSWDCKMPLGLLLKMCKLIFFNLK